MVRKGCFLHSAWMAYLVMFCILLSERAHALIPPPQAAVTPRAVLPRAMETLGWFSAGAANGSTTYAAFTLGSDEISSKDGYWFDWCKTAWCYYFTDCSGGTIAGPHTTATCNGGNTCYTEVVLPSFGATVPQLRKVFCYAGGWVSRTYYKEKPLSSYTFAQPPLDWAVRAVATTSSPSTSPTSSSSSTASSSLGTSTVLSNPLSSPGGISTPTSSPTTAPLSNNGRGSDNTRAIAGSVVGGVALVGIFVLIAIYMLRKTRKPNPEPQSTYDYFPTFTVDNGMEQHKPLTELYGDSNMEQYRPELHEKTVLGERPGDVQRY